MFILKSSIKRPFWIQIAIIYKTLSFQVTEALIKPIQFKKPAK